MKILLHTLFSSLVILAPVNAMAVNPYSTMILKNQGVKGKTDVIYNSNRCPQGNSGCTYCWIDIRARWEKWGVNVVRDKNRRAIANINGTVKGEIHIKPGHNKNECLLEHEKVHLTHCMTIGNIINKELAKLNNKIRNDLDLNAVNIKLHKAARVYTKMYENMGEEFHRTPAGRPCVDTIYEEHNVF